MKEQMVYVISIYGDGIKEQTPKTIKAIAEVFGHPRDFKTEWQFYDSIRLDANKAEIIFKSKSSASRMQEALNGRPFGFHNSFPARVEMNSNPIFGEFC